MAMPRSRLRETAFSLSSFLTMTGNYFFVLCSGENTSEIVLALNIANFIVGIPVVLAMPIAASKVQLHKQILVFSLALILSFFVALILFGMIFASAVVFVGSFLFIEFVASQMGAYWTIVCIRLLCFGLSLLPLVLTDDTSFHMRSLGVSIAALVTVLMNSSKLRQRSLGTAIKAKNYVLLVVASHVWLYLVPLFLFASVSLGQLKLVYVFSNLFPLLCLRYIDSAIKWTLLGQQGALIGLKAFLEYFSTAIVVVYVAVGLLLYCLSYAALVSSAIFAAGSTLVALYCVSLCKSLLTQQPAKKD